MTHPLPDTSPSARQEDARTPAEQDGEAGSPADDAAQAGRLPIHPTTADVQKPVSPASPTPTAAQPIRKLKPGEPPPESSAGS